MPLHLLGKKSWNVYNQDNIAAVRRDEAAAEIHAREKQRRNDEADAESRLQILRGAKEEAHEEGQLDHTQDKHASQTPPRRKKRRFDSDAVQVEEIATPKPVSTLSRQKDISLIDNCGHFNLFPEGDARRVNGNAEVAADSAKRRQDFEDQYTMRLVNAGGRNASSDKPWYNIPAKDDVSSTAVVSKNVWGNEDPRRRDRAQKRMDANDPLAAIKKGVKQLREADKHREEWRAQRESDLNEVEELARKSKHRKKRERGDEESLDGFDLDEGYHRDHSDQRKRKSLSGSHRRRHKQGSQRHRDDRGRA